MLRRTKGFSGNSWELVMVVNYRKHSNFTKSIRAAVGDKTLLEVSASGFHHEARQRNMGDVVKWTCCEKTEIYMTDELLSSATLLEIQSEVC